MNHDSPIIVGVLASVLAVALVLAVAVAIDNIVGFIKSKRKDSSS